MPRTFQILITMLVATFLFSGGSAVAYHWEGENENRRYMTVAGDENVLRDGADCFNATAEMDDVHCVVLYGHLFDLLNRVPINVQSPAECAPDLARGFTGEIHTGSRNQINLASSPGFVEYTEETCGAPGQEDPRIHPERGLASTLRISGEVPIYGYWYLSADAAEFSPMSIGTGPDAEPSAGVMPCVTVRMQVWTQEYVGLGTLISEGETTKTVVSTPAALEDQPDQAHGLVPDPCPGSDGTIDPERVTEFRVAMEPESEPEIPDYEGYVIGVQWYQHDGGDPDDDDMNLLQREWNLHTGQEFPNRVVMAVEDSIRIDEFWFQEFNNLLWIRGSINTPWGSYDLDTNNVRVSLLDQAGEEIPMENLGEPRFDVSVDHDGHFKPINVTYGWDVYEQGLEPGVYTIRLEVTNWQHTEDAVSERTFTVRDDMKIDTPDEPPAAEENGSPLPAWVVIVAVLVPLARAMGRLRGA